MINSLTKDGSTHVTALHISKYGQFAFNDPGGATVKIQVTFLSKIKERQIRLSTFSPAKYFNGQSAETLLFAKNGIFIAFMITEGEKIFLRMVDIISFELDCSIKIQNYIIYELLGRN